MPSRSDSQHVSLVVRGELQAEIIKSRGVDNILNTSTVTLRWNVRPWSSDLTSLFPASKCSFSSWQKGFWLRSYRLSQNTGVQRNVIILSIHWPLMPPRRYRHYAF